MEKSLARISKTLSYALRHRPEALGLALDSNGWVEVSALLDGLRAAGHVLDESKLRLVVEQNDKQRFEFDADCSRIRARQGHSVDVDLQLEAREPPDSLFHGTAERFLDSILEEGLDRRQRHHVHLSADIGTATRVGQRHGAVVVLRVDAGRMHRDGHRFFRTENGVWLTAGVPPEYLLQ
ncbi:MAG: RNA 2'-phosphotransferase [Planctomycetota bacterium]